MASHEQSKATDLLGIFVRHPVAANMLMVIMILAGVWGLNQLNRQFFPEFNLDFVNVQTVWSGATAEDVEKSITNSIEQALRSTDDVKQMTSTSADGVSAVTLEFEEGIDLSSALDEVRQQVDRISGLPSTAEQSEVSRIVRYENIARILLFGDVPESELRSLAWKYERELIDRGIAKADPTGLAAGEIAIQVSSAKLREVGLTLAQVASRVAATSRDIPVGNAGKDELARQLRFVAQGRSVADFQEMTIAAGDGQIVRLGDIANIERRGRDKQVTLSYRGNPAVSLIVQRASDDDTLAAAETISQWYEQTKPDLPQGVEMLIYTEDWKLLRGRINVLLKNGLSGLALVILILFLFLSARVAFWVTVGIPISFLATLFVLYLVGGSINMLSLFALIMALGIIVDDAIVVGENALAQFQEGKSPVAAAEGGARKMFAPVMSSSITTIAAFMPLMLVSGIIGSILKSIPVVIICVIIASVIESFYILPGHLRHTFESAKEWRPGKFRTWFNNAFDAFTEKFFRRVVRVAVRFRWATFASAVAILIITIGLIAGRHVGFRFFPTPEGTIIFANASFVSGTPKATVKKFMTQMENDLYELEVELDEKFVVITTVNHGTTIDPADRGGNTIGDQFGSILVELKDADFRSVRNADIIEMWRERIQDPPGIENINIVEPQVGPPGRDLEFRLTGDDIDIVKAASLDLQQYLNSITGVAAVSDDLPFGRQQLILELTPLAQNLGLTVETVSQQLRAGFDGFKVQEFPEGNDDIEVRVVLPDDERGDIGALENLSIAVAGGASIPLSNVVSISQRQGFEAVRHADGKLAVTVGGSVNPKLANENDIRAKVVANKMPELIERYGIRYSQEGRAADQEKTLADMKLGALLALSIIYIVLTWVFGSYGWPLVVMAVIPFGIVGAIWGHWWMGIDVTLLSLFGFFGLSGIVVNDSIVLVVFYKELKEKTANFNEAIVEAACKRLRAVLLTSLTTIAGLLPLLFEKSLQAQFLIPMATTIAFGLAFATLLVLVLIPALLSIHESIHDKLGWVRSRFRRPDSTTAA